MLIQVEYRAPVLVLVDTEARRVVSVAVLDEDVTRDECSPFWTEDGTERVTRGQRTLNRRALDVAESEEWPSWEIGW